MPPGRSLQTPRRVQKRDLKAVKALQKEQGLRNRKSAEHRLSVAPKADIFDAGRDLRSPARSAQAPPSRQGGLHE